MALCKLCGEDKKLIKAHIYPKSFFESMKEEQQHPIEGSNKPGVFPSKRPIGIYDAEIVCEDCERLFSPWDSYGKQFFLDTDWDELPREIEQGVEAILVEDFDYTKLKLFVLSVLWRASASERDFFGRIDLGPFFERVAAQLRAGDPGKPADFAVMLSKFRPTGQVIDPKAALLNPQRSRIDGINYVKLWLADFTILIKVDQRPVKGLFSIATLRPDGPAIIVLRDFMSSKELLAQAKVVKGAYN